jgi:hypothetical protein
MPNDWIAQLMSWLPFIVLILVWLFVSQYFLRNQVFGFYKAQVTEMQRTNALLERIAVALEKRAECP